jgi:uroporphyrinogen-III synthase
MAMSDAARRNFCRAIAEARRGRVSSSDMGERLLECLKAKGLRVVEEEPDLEAMAAALVEAGYQVAAPNAE